MISLAVSCAALLLGLPPAPGPTAPKVAQHVVIVGVNHSNEPGVEPLQFADNDAARYAEVLAPGAASLQLLTVLDAANQARFPQATLLARAPTRAQLQRALSETFARMHADRALGVDVDLLFIYVGHGARDKHGEGYLTLLDGRLTRSELFAQLIEPSPARFNHLIIDACHAFYVVNRSSHALQSVREVLDAATLHAHPNTGVLLASSRDKVTHEWSLVEGGVFSHQVLSAFLGAADVDHDRALTYAEVGAFVEAANQGVQDRRARVDLFLQPPRLQLSRPLWRQPDDDTQRLVLAKNETGAFVVHDGRGVSVAALNKNPEQELVVSLVGVPPFSVAHGSAGYQTSSTQQREWTLPTLQSTDETLRARASISDALQRGLYSVPFGVSYVAGYSARLERELDQDPGPVAESTASPPGAMAREAQQPVRRTPAPQQELAVARPVYEQPSEPPFWSTWNAVTWSGLGLGTLAGVAGVVALGAGGVALARWNAIEQGRNGSMLASEAETLADEGNSAVVVGAVAAGVGLTLGAGTAALLLLAPQE